MSFIKGINVLTGISEEKLNEYATTNNIFNILEHPRTINPGKDELDKIRLLNEFLISYRLLKQSEKDNKITFKSPEDSGNYFASLLAGIKDRERFIVAFLDRANNLIETRVMSEGNIGESVIYPRMLLKAAMDCDCSGILLSHNHPSGSIKPSGQDLAVTGILVSIFAPLEIPILDHIIVGNLDYYSMATHGDIPKASQKLIKYDPVIYTEKPNTSQQSIEAVFGIKEEKSEVYKINTKPDRSDR